MASDTKVADDTIPRFAIYRAADAPDLGELDCMEAVAMTSVIATGLGETLSEGGSEGNVVKVLFSMPGMSLAYAWFKSGFPLPLHSHNVNCLYYVIAGSLRIGTEDLGAGDGFFVGSEVPYSYRPGPDGVELLEFRTAESFDIRFLGKTKAYWDKAVEAVREARPKWANESRPSEMARLGPRDS